MQVSTARSLVRAGGTGSGSHQRPQELFGVEMNRQKDDWENYPNPKQFQKKSVSPAIHPQE